MPKGPKGLPAVQTPWPTGHVLCRFGPQLRGHVSTRGVEGQGGRESRWRLLHPTGRSRGLAGGPPLSAKPTSLSQWSSPTAL
jgi:hypothetical protein